MESLPLDILYYIFRYIGIKETFLLRGLCKSWFKIIYNMNPKFIDSNYKSWDHFIDILELKWCYRYDKNLIVTEINVKNNIPIDIGYFLDSNLFWIKFWKKLIITDSLISQNIIREYDLTKTAILSRNISPKFICDENIKEFIRIDEKTGNELKKAKLNILSYFFTDNLILFVKGDNLYYIHNNEWDGNLQIELDEKYIFNEKNNLGKFTLWDFEYDNIENFNKSKYFNEKTMKQESLPISKYISLHFDKIFGERGFIEIGANPITLYTSNGKKMELFDKDFIYFEYCRFIPEHTIKIVQASYESKSLIYEFIFREDNDVLWIGLEIIKDSLILDGKNQTFYRLTKKDYENGIKPTQIQKENIPESRLPNRRIYEVEIEFLPEIPNNKLNGFCLSSNEFYELNQLDGILTIYKVDKNIESKNINDKINKKRKY